MITREEAKALLSRYLKKESLIAHCYATALIMEQIADRLGEDRELYFITGYLHDIDLEVIGDDMNLHAKKGVEILKGYDLPETLLNAVLSHNKHKDLETNLEKALWMSDPVNGLIVASALMRPDKLISSMNMKSLKKKFKSKNFASGVSREQIKDCSMLDFELVDFLQLSLDIMAVHEKELGLGVVDE